MNHTSALHLALTSPEGCRPAPASWEELRSNCQAKITLAGEFLRLLRNSGEFLKQEASQLRVKITDLGSRGVSCRGEPSFSHVLRGPCRSRGTQRQAQPRRSSLWGPRQSPVPLISENLNDCFISLPTGSQGISRTPGVMRYVKNATKYILVEGNGSDVDVVQMVQVRRTCHVQTSATSIRSSRVNSRAFIKSRDNLGVLAASSWSG